MAQVVYVSSETQPLGGHASHDWISPFCGCFDDCGSCLLAWCCPCILFGMNQEAAGLGDCFLCGAAWFLLNALGGWGFILGCLKRTELRKNYGIHGDECSDCILHCCCHCCAIAQEYREIKVRGPAVHHHHHSSTTVVATAPPQQYVAVVPQQQPYYGAAPTYQATPAATAPPSMYPK